jgi:hypothetical protein
MTGTNIALVLHDAERADETGEHGMYALIFDSGVADRWMTT